MADGLRAVGYARAEPPRRPVLEKDGVTLVTLAVLGPAGRPSWHGLFASGGSVRALGPEVPPSTVPARARAGEGARALLDLLVAASLSYVERLEELGERLDAIEMRAEAGDVGELAALERDLSHAAKHLGRLEVLLAELAGPLGGKFPGVAPALPGLTAEAARTRGLASALQESARDRIGLQTAFQANRLAAVANDLGRTSNRIAALANTSNLRMLGVAYIALALALVSAVVLIPNTAATILGMPSAAWVPGLWVDTVLAVLALAPLAIVFSRRWVRRMLADWRTFEERTAEGLADLPELPAGPGHPRDASERLIRERP